MIESELNEKQRLLLWRLAIADGPVWLADVAAGLSGKPIRDGLICSGLISEEKRPRQVPGKRTTRALVMTLEDRGWAWLADHMDLPIWKSNTAAEVLRGLLGQLQAYCRRDQVALGEIFATRPAENDQRDSAQSGHVTETAIAEAPATISAAADTTTAEGIAPATGTAREQIVAAYAQLAGHRSNARVRLSALRRQLIGISREEVDRALCQMASDGSIVLNRLDNPVEITAADEAALIRNGLGEPRHILHMNLAVGEPV